MIDSEIIEVVMETAEDDYLDLTDIMHFTHRLTASQAEALRMAAAIASHLIRAGRITPGGAGIQRSGPAHFETS